MQQVRNLVQQVRNLVLESLDIAIQHQPPFQHPTELCSSVLVRHVMSLYKSEQEKSFYYHRWSVAQQLPSLRPSHNSSNNKQHDDEEDGTN